MSIDQETFDRVNAERIAAEKRVEELTALLRKARDYIEYSPNVGTPTTNLVVEIDAAITGFKPTGHWLSKRNPKYLLEVESFEFEPFVSPTETETADDADDRLDDEGDASWVHDPDMGAR